MEIIENNARYQLEILHKQGDWRGVLNIIAAGFHEPQLLWLRPNEESLNFIIRHVKSRDLQRVLSLGCGTGLFEWLLASAAPDVEVVGVEVDESWWTSCYAPPTFIPLCYADSPNAQEEVMNQSDSALLFCYFNCEAGWRSYLNHFKGNLVIVCGPIKGSGTHSDPQPFQHLTPEWTVVDGHRVGLSHDYIAVYARI